MPEAKTGKLIHEGGRYFLEVDRKRHELSTEIVDEKQLAELVGKEVSLSWSEPVRTVIGISGASFRPPRILCYFVLDPILTRGVLVSQPEVQAKLLKEFVDKGIISKEVHGQLAKQ